MGEQRSTQSAATNLVRRVYDAVADRTAQWWWLDVPVLTLAVLALAKWAPWANVLDDMARADRLSVYTDMLTLTGLFAGFGGVTFAVYLGMTSRAIERLRQRVGGPLLAVWIAVLVTPWLCGFALIVAKVLDKGAGGGSVSWIVAYIAMAVVVVQLARTVWVFVRLALLDQRPDLPAMPTTSRPVSVLRRSS